MSNPHTRAVILTMLCESGACMQRMRIDNEVMLDQITEPMDQDEAYECHKALEAYAMTVCGAFEP